MNVDIRIDICGCMYVHMCTHPWQGWHNTGVMNRLDGLLRASTAKVLGESLPRVVVMDGLNAQNGLNYNVPHQWLPTSMYHKALKLVNEHEKFILKGATPLESAASQNTGVQFPYYVLSMGHQDVFERISYGLVTKCVPPMLMQLCPRLLSNWVGGHVQCTCTCTCTYKQHVPCMHDWPRFDDLCAGRLPNGYKKNVSWDKLKDLKNAMHKITATPEEEHFYLTCPANPFKLVCHGCKTFCRVACCPHVLAVTHMLEQEKPEGERDGRRDLHKLMCTLNRSSSRGGGGEPEAEDVDDPRPRHRNRKRAPARGRRSEAQQGGRDGGKGEAQKRGGKGRGVGTGRGISKGIPARAATGRGRGGGGGGAGGVFCRPWPLHRRAISFRAAAHAVTLPAAPAQDPSSTEHNCSSCFSGIRVPPDIWWPHGHGQYSAAKQ